MRFSPTYKDQFLDEMYIRIREPVRLERFPQSFVRFDQMIQQISTCVFVCPILTIMS